MKTIFNNKLFLFITLLLLLSPKSFAQGDINLKISESSINQTLQVLVDSKAINFARYDGSYGLSTYNINITAAQAVLNPSGNGNIRIDLDLTARATFNLLLFHFDVNVEASLGIYGSISKVQQDQGYKLIMNPQEVAYFSLTGTFLDDIVEDEINGFITQLPEITIASYTSLLPSIVSQYFTPESPILTVTSDEVILSLNIVAGPRFITAYNDLNQQTNIGNVQDEEGPNNYVSYPSPKTFSWNTGTTHKLQTPVSLIDAPNGKYKYIGWFKNPGLVPQQEIAPRRIQLTVGNQDESYLALFGLAKRVQLSNLLEGQYTGGTVTYENTTAPSFDDYDFYSTTQSHPINTNVPNGTLGVNWIFQKWNDGNTNQSRNIVLSNDVNLIANYKGHLYTNTPTATTTNSQRKIVQASNGYWAMVYVSTNNVWLSRSTDGVNWENEIKISDSDCNVNGFPSITVSYDKAYIVWQSISLDACSGFGDECDILMCSYDLANNSLGPIINVTEFTPPSSTTYAAAPVIDYIGSKTDDVVLAWKEPDAIKVIYYSSSTGLGNKVVVPGTNSYSSNPSLAYANGYKWAICWQHSYGGNKIYYSTIEHLSYPPDWTFTNTSFITPSDWTDNSSPQITVVNRYYPTIVWTSRNNIIEGGPSVHVRQRSGMGVNDIWGTITSFSHPNSGASLSPVIGNYYNSNKMEVLWNISNTVYKGYYNGTSWAGPTTLTTSGGTGVNINKASVYNNYVTKALWKKSDNSIAFYNIGSRNNGLSDLSIKGVDGDPETPLSYRLIRHSVLDLSDGNNSNAKGSICFEIAGIKTITNNSESNINYSADENKLLSSEPFKVEVSEMQLSFAGAIYGAGLELPDKFISSINEPLAKVTLKDSKTDEELQNIWVNKTDMLSQVKNKTFGEYRNEIISLNKYLGKTVYVEVEMLGKTNNITPIIVDDYLILYDSSAIAKSVANNSVNQLPTDYTLMQNYPNPFNPSTSIDFFIPQNEYVTLKIFNSIGEEIMTAINADLEQGYHTVNINLSNESSGVYFYSLSAGNFRDTKKLILLK